MKNILSVLIIDLLLGIFTGTLSGGYNTILEWVACCAFFTCFWILMLLPALNYTPANKGEQ